MIEKIDKSVADKILLKYALSAYKKNSLYLKKEPAYTLPKVKIPGLGDKLDILV